MHGFADASALPTELTRFKFIASQGLEPHLYGPKPLVLPLHQEAMKYTTANRQTRTDNILLGRQALYH